MPDMSPAEMAVEKSLEAMTQTLRDLTKNLGDLKDDVDDKLDSIRVDVGGLKQTLAEMAVENRHWVGRAEFVRLEAEADAREAAIVAEADAREKAIVAEAETREKADDRLDKRFWFLFTLIVTVALGLAVEYLKKGGTP